MEFGKAAQMELIDDRVLPRDSETPRLPSPIEIRIDDDAFGHIGRAVALIEGGVVAGFELIAENRRVPSQIAKMSARIGVEHQFVRIATVAALRLIRTVHAIAIDAAGGDVRHVTVPDLVGVFGKFDVSCLALAGVVKETEFDSRRMGGEQREIDALAVPGGA